MLDQAAPNEGAVRIAVPSLQTDNVVIDRAYRIAIGDIRIHGQGQRVEEMLVNGKPETLIAATTRGKVEVVIRVGK
ncbi:MAG: hypothetical protein H7A46_15610 [Verrucomicrobiales bacterium]|nr:hypothetical protein [Verrucomicrobiales bacterium]